MTHRTRGRLARPLHALCAQLAQADRLPCSDILTEDRVGRALEQEGVRWRDCLDTPLVTLAAFLWQVLSKDGSCRAAVARVLAWLAGAGQPPGTADTGPYCKARPRLPEGLLSRLARQTGPELHRQAPLPWWWRGRRVKLVDGTTVSRPDTAANQEAYPQHNAPRPGLGFPLARLVVVFCLAVGTVLDAALGRYQGKQSGANALFRTLPEGLEPGDVVRADRYSCSWWDIARLERRGVDIVCRLHQLRKADFRRGLRLGSGDHAVAWDRPARPAWMDEAPYPGRPDLVVVRPVRVQVVQPGFRPRGLVGATPLLEQSQVPACARASLYRARWHAALDLRSLKVALGMDVLRCLSPGMVRKEVWAHLLGDNLVRTVMAQAAQQHGRLPRQVSFTGALQVVTAFADTLRRAERGELPALPAALLAAVARHEVGNRPDRAEPRARKRRPKHYPLLTRPRAEARKRLGRTG